MDSYPPSSPAPSLDSIDMSSSPGYSPQQPHQQLRRRHAVDAHAPGSNGSYADDDDELKKKAFRRRMVKNLDLFPKVEQDLEVTTDRGGLVTLIGYCIILVLLFAEIAAWNSQNKDTVEHVIVDQALGKKMRININITFPGLHCDDLHVDAMDVAGDSQVDLEDTMVKRRLHLDGSPMGKTEIEVKMNKAHEEDEKKKKLTSEELPADYCGPCYGAHETEDQCCNTCDEVQAAYKKKRWNADSLVLSAEQCVREGKGSSEPKRMSKGEGCNLSGYMTVNRVAGNFHIAMGEGVERDGRHIHQFIPEDRPNFNASHIIHELSFGPKYSTVGRKDGTTLDGTRKVTTEDNGTTGLFQYFIKIVPTTYKGRDLVKSLASSFSPSSAQRADTAETVGEDEMSLETNRYFYTERYRPLMEDLDDEHHKLGNDGALGAHIGGSSGGSHDHQQHHHIQNSVLPGVFFVYEIYPFAVEVSQSSVPLTHLMIRIMATVGGVFTIVGWADAYLHAKEKGRGKGRR